jgi:ornithine cyclodeaminase/alanine dehydrogenase-like protein (mu-crystallin family)
MLILSRADLERLLTPREVVDALETVFALSASGRAEAPGRMALPAGADGVLLVMPAALRGDAGGGQNLGNKLVSVYPGNRARGHPTLYATYILMDGATGQPLALVEGTYLTALRTGATSALAARLLARRDARRVVCFGAGVQAGFQLTCLASVLPIEHVSVVGRDPARARSFAERMSGRIGVPVDPVRDARAEVRAADIVTCATTSRDPVVFGADLRPGAHLDLVGAFRPTDREADTEAIRRARVVVDTYAGALEEAGDVLIPMKEGAIRRDHVAAELAEIVTGARSGRTREDEITVFKSVGWALEDLATARLAYNRAVAQHVGIEVTL